MQPTARPCLQDIYLVRHALFAIFAEVGPEVVRVQRQCNAAEGEQRVRELRKPLCAVACKLANPHLSLRCQLGKVQKCVHQGVQGLGYRWGGR